jgi:hypothetical protein
MGVFWRLSGENTKYIRTGQYPSSRQKPGKPGKPGKQGKQDKPGKQGKRDKRDKRVNKKIPS